MKIVSATIVPTGIEGTSAAHLVIDHRYDESPITVAWATTPTVCSDCGDGPVHQPADEVPAIVYSTIDGFPIWHARTEARCGTCGKMVGPWALVRDEHLEGDELTEVAREVAELADEDR
ncbi:MAG TPA: hypothetical protein VIL36_11220 [Acidimicrobiales bacterium]